MKNKIVLLFILLISISGISQNRIGVFVGYNNSVLGEGFLKNIEGLGVIQDSNARKAFHIGGLFELELNDLVTFRPKLVFSLQGDNPNYKSTYRGFKNYGLSYLNIPLSFKFFSKPSIIIGPQVGILLGTEKGDVDFGDIEKTLDFGVNFGVGYDINNFFLELNFYQGIQTIITVSRPSFPEGRTDDITNTVLQFSIGYYFIK